MYYVEIRKIKEIPFRINPEEDEVLATGLSMGNHMQALEELGYLRDSKEMVLDDGTLIYYKGKKNGVYFCYRKKSLY